MYKRIKVGWSKHIDVMIIDLFALNVAFYVSYFLRFGFKSPSENPIYADLLLAVFGLHIALVFFVEPYSGMLRRGKLQECKCTFIYATKFLVGILLYMFISKRTGILSRLMLTYFYISSILLMGTFRLLLKRYLITSCKTTGKTHYVLMVTKYKDAKQHIKKFKKNGNYGSMSLVGLVITDQNMTDKKIEKIPVVAGVEDMMEYVRINVVDQILITGEGEWLAETVQRLVNMGITVHIIVNQLISEFPNSIVEEINGLHVITTSIHIASDRQLFLKRCLDYLGGVVGIILCSIACLFVAPIIKIQSPGPILFTQIRIGKNGRKFKLYKFRSMYMDAEERKKELMDQNEMQGFMFKMKNDPRIFPFGRFLRKFSIDELPQFWNVLRGDMSLVGTRPPTVDEYEQYKLEHKVRLATKPGITGLWQISGRSDITNFEEVVELDNEYIRNWRLGLDIKILLWTVPAVIAGGGAK